MPSAGMHHLFARLNGSSWQDAPAAFLLDRLQTSNTTVDTSPVIDGDDNNVKSASSALPAAVTPRLARAFTCKGPSGIHRFISIGSGRGDVEWLVDITPRGSSTHKLSDDAQAALALLMGFPETNALRLSTLDAALPSSVFLCEHSGHIVAVQLLQLDAATLLLTVDAIGCVRMWSLDAASADPDACAWAALTAFEIDDILPPSSCPPRSAASRVIDAYYDVPAQLLFLVTPVSDSPGHANVCVVPLALTGDADAELQVEVGVCLDTIHLPLHGSGVLHGVEGGVWILTSSGAHTWARSQAAAGTCSASNAAALSAVMHAAPSEGSPQLRGAAGDALPTSTAAVTSGSLPRAEEEADEDAIVSRAYVCTATWASVAPGATVLAVAVGSQPCLYALTHTGAVMTLTYEPADEASSHDEGRVRVQALCNCAAVAALVESLSTRDAALRTQMAVRDMYGYILLQSDGAACLCIVDLATGTLMQCIDMPSDDVAFAVSHAHDAPDAYMSICTPTAMYAAVPPAVHVHAAQLCSRLLSSLPARQQDVTRNVIVHALTAYACSTLRMTHTALRHAIAAVVHGDDALTLVAAGVFTPPTATHTAPHLLQAISAVSSAWAQLRGGFPLLAACVHPLQDTIASTDDVSIPAIVHALYACGASRAQIRRALGGDAGDEAPAELRVTAGPLTAPQPRGGRARIRAQSHTSHNDSSDEEGAIKPAPGGNDVCDDILDGALPAHSSGASEHTHAAMDVLMQYLTAVVAYRRVTLASELPTSSPIDIAARAQALIAAASPITSSSSSITPMQAACSVTALSASSSVQLRVQKRLVELARGHTFNQSYEDTASHMQPWTPPECTLTRMRDQLGSYDNVTSLAAALDDSNAPLLPSDAIVHPVCDTHTFDVCVRVMDADDVSRVVEALDAGESPLQRGVMPPSAAAHTSLHSQAAARPRTQAHVPASSHACSVLYNVDATLSLLKQHTRAVTLLLAAGRIDEAVAMLAHAESEDGYTHVDESPTPATRSLARSRSRVDTVTLGQLESRGLLTVPALLQGRVRAPKSAPRATRGGPRGVATPAVTLSALGTAVRWANTSTRRMAYFHLLFMHALRAGDVALLMRLWTRIPPAYTLPSVLLSLRAAVATHTADAPSRAADIPASAVLPALHSLLEVHFDALDEWARWWKDAHLRPDAVVLRSWGHAPLPSGAGQNTTNSSLTS